MRTCWASRRALFRCRTPSPSRALGTRGDPRVRSARDGNGVREAGPLLSRQPRVEPHGGRRETQPARRADPRRKRIGEIERVARGGGEGESAPRGPPGGGAGKSEGGRGGGHHGGLRGAEAPP